MRYDLRVLWVDDTEAYFTEEMEVVNTYAEDHGISVEFRYLDNPSDFLEIIRKDGSYFKMYDIFFIDYALATNLLGSELIRELKNNEYVTDILFYSTQNEKEIRTIISNNVGSYEGVYIARKENFEEKAQQLIIKNARNLTSLYNIRGFLMDQTSENDYTIISYIEEKYSLLNSDQKSVIGDIIISSLREEFGDDYKKANDVISKIENNGAGNIKKIFDYKKSLITVSTKYKVFMKMLEFMGETAFSDYSVQEYLDEIVKARNTLAHKKLDICKMQKYILYYDDVRQFRGRVCPPNCDDHNDDNKYSLEAWEDIRRKARLFEKGIIKIQESL